ncbi:MAG: energy transducer TonB [Flavobacteriia bacterium]|nr:energy transducer TonB [Flavobacteriia bacterium]
MNKINIVSIFILSLLCLSAFSQNNENIEVEEVSASEVSITESTDLVLPEKIIKDSINYVFDLVDMEAEFPGGKEALIQFIQQNLIYPQNAKEEEIQGKSYVRIIVNQDGSISPEIKVLKGVVACPECDQEAIRIVKLMPKWKPGQINGKIVRSYYILPVKFML